MRTRRSNPDKLLRPKSSIGSSSVDEPKEPYGPQEVLSSGQHLELHQRKAEKDQQGREIHALKGVVCLKFSALGCSSRSRTRHKAYGKGEHKALHIIVQGSRETDAAKKKSSALCSPMARL